jgi:hypothetical protein
VQPTEDVFVYVYVLIDDAVASGAIEICSDAELLTIEQVRHLLGRRSEAGFPGRGGPRLGAPVPGLAAPKRGQPADPLVRGTSGQFRAHRAAKEDADSHLTGKGRYARMHAPHPALPCGTRLIACTSAPLVVVPAVTVLPRHRLPVAQVDDAAERSSSVTKSLMIRTGPVPRSRPARRDRCRDDGRRR